MNSKKTINHGLLSGSLSGVVTTLAFQPFDVIKTRLQVSKTVASKESDILANSRYSKVTSPSIRSVIQQIYAAKKLRGFWDGTTASLLRTVPGISLYFGFLTLLNNQQKTYLDESNKISLQNGVTAMTARFLAGFILMPFTFIKLRYESGLFSYHSLRDAFVKTLNSRKGVKALYSGMSGTMARDLPYSYIYYASYCSCKSYFARAWPGLFAGGSGSGSGSDREPNAVCVCVSAFSSSTLAVFLTQPADLFKMHFQIETDARHRTFSRIARRIYAERGISGFYVGVLPRLMRRNFISIVSWLIYERI